MLKKNLPVGLYVLGLSNHVGYLSVEEGGDYFMHSNYFDPENGVIKEKVKQSTALDYNTDFVIGSISNNREFVKKWLYGKEIKVVLDL